MTTIGVIAGDTRSLDYGSCSLTWGSEGHYGAASKDVQGL